MSLCIIDLKRVVAYIYEHIKMHTTCQINYKFQETLSFILFCQCLIRNWSIDMPTEIADSCKSFVL